VSSRRQAEAGSEPCEPAKGSALDLLDLLAEPSADSTHSRDSTVTGTRDAEAQRNLLIHATQSRSPGRPAEQALRAGDKSETTNRLHSIPACCLALVPLRGASGASRTAVFSASRRLCVSVSVESASTRHCPTTATGTKFTLEAA
jgi:hypothetical protein